MAGLLSACITAFVGYVIVSGVSLYLLRRFLWLDCIRKVRPRRCGQHILSYGVLLLYLVFCAWTHHGSAFFQSPLDLAASSKRSKGTGPAFGVCNAAAAAAAAAAPCSSSIWPVRVCSAITCNVIDAFLRPWIQFPPLSATAATPTSSVATLVLSSALYALAQTLAATCLYGSLATWCHARWRYVALRTVEKHADVWAFLFPTSPAEMASLLKIEALRTSRQQLEMEESTDSLTGNSRMFMLRSPTTSRRCSTQVSIVDPTSSSSSSGGGGGDDGVGVAVAAAAARRLQTSTHTQLNFPRFGADGSNTGTGIGDGSDAGHGRASMTATSQHHAVHAVSTAQEDNERQRHHLLLARERFLSNFWIRDSTLLLLTLFFFNSLALGRVIVTFAVVSVWTQRVSSSIASTVSGASFIGAKRTSFIPYPTEGYVAVIGLCYLALLRLFRRRQMASLHDLLVLVRNSTTAPAAGAAAAPPLGLFSPLAQQRQPRLSHNVYRTGNNSEPLSPGHNPLFRFSGSALSLRSPSLPADVLCNPGFDNATSSGMATLGLHDYLQALPRSRTSGSTQSAGVFTRRGDNNDEDRCTLRASERNTIIASDGGNECCAAPFARWSFWPLWCARPRSQPSDAAAARGSTTASHSADPMVETTSTTAATISLTPGTARTAETAVLPLPQFRFVFFTTAVLFALQILPDSTFMWASALLIITGCAALTARSTLHAPLSWISTDYRKLLQCSWWTLFLSRDFSPCTMDVVKVVRNLSPQQYRHLVELQAVDAHHRHVSSIEKDEDGMAKDAFIPFSINALVEAATFSTSKSNNNSNNAPTATTATATPPLTLDPVRSSTPADMESQSTSFVATVVAILGEASDVETGRVLAGHDAPGIGEGGGVLHDAEVKLNNPDNATAKKISPMQFWHGVATKMLEQPAAQDTAQQQDNPYPGIDLGGGAIRSNEVERAFNDSFAGLLSTTLANSFAGFPSLPETGIGGAPVTSDNVGDWNEGNSAAASLLFAKNNFLGVSDPFRAAAAAVPVPIAPSLELDNELCPGFKKENMKKSMLRMPPGAARTGAAAERERKEEVKKFARQAAAIERAAQAKEDEASWAENVLRDEASTDHLGSSPSTSRSSPRWSPPQQDHSMMQLQQTTPLREGRRLSLVPLATFVPGVAGHRSSTSSHTDSRGSQRPYSPTSPRDSPPPAAYEAEENEDDEEAFTSELPAEVRHNISIASSLSRASSSATRALLANDDGFERFLRHVQRDGDNIYALKTMLSSYGHTYSRRVDAKGRSALHYAVMGGFVRGVWFLANIGAEPNIRDRAGYSPLHYAVLHHTEYRLAPAITDGNTSRVVQQARYMAGIPVVATASAQAPGHARKRRQVREQRHQWFVQPRLQDTLSSSVNSSNGTGRSRTADLSASSDVFCIENSDDAPSPLSWAEEHQIKQRCRSHNRRRAGGGSSSGSCNNSNASNKPVCIPISSLYEDGNTEGQLLTLLPTGAQNAAEGIAPTTPTTTAGEQHLSSTVVADAAAIAQEEHGQWYGMVDRLLSLGAEVDFPTTGGLTALHLAVLHGNIGLVNTLLRGGANPLLGAEPEAQTLLTTAVEAPHLAEEKSEETPIREGEEVEVSEEWMKQVNEEFLCPGVRQRQREQQEQQQQARQRGFKLLGGEEQGGETLSSGHESESEKEKRPSSRTPSPAHSVSKCEEDDDACPFRKPPFATNMEWVSVHITNAGNPIVMGYCKSPLLLAVELDSDLVVASMLHHVTLRATSARVAAILPAGKLNCNSSNYGSGRGVRATHETFGLGSDGNALHTSSNSNSFSLSLPVAKRCTRESPNPSVAIVDSKSGVTPLQQPPFVPFSMPSPALSAVATPYPRSASSASKGPSFTEAYAAGVLLSSAHRSSNPLIDNGVSETTAAVVPHVNPAVAAAPALPSAPTAIFAVDRNSNSCSPTAIVVDSGSGGGSGGFQRPIRSNSSSADLLSVTGASAAVYTSWEIPSAQAFNAIRVALVLGHAQVARVLLLRWNYNGIVRGADDVTLSAAAVAKTNSAAATSVNTSTSTTTVPIDVRDAALTTALECGSGARSPTVAQIALPIHDEGGQMVFVGGCGQGGNNSDSSSDEEAGTGQEPNSPLALDRAHNQDERLLPNPNHYHSKLHRCGHTDATATLSLSPFIGVSAFWVVALRLNFFHLAAIGNSTECLAYVLLWRGLPDYVPCALDNAFSDRMHVKDPRHVSHVVPTASAARGTDQRDQQESARSMDASRSAKITPVKANGPLLQATALTTTAEAGHATSEVTPQSTSNRKAIFSYVSEFENRTNALVNSSVLKSPSRSSSSVSAVSTPRSTTPMDGPQVTTTEAVVATLPPPTASASLSSSARATGFAGRRGITSSATPTTSLSEFFDITWSSSNRTSLDTVSSSTAPRLAHARTGSACLPKPTRRAQRLRAKQRAFIQALITLLQTSIRGDAVRRRVCTTVFGRGGGAAGAALRHFINTTTRSTIQDEGANVVVVDNDAIDRAAAASSSFAVDRMTTATPLVEEQNSVMAKTCFGSAAAAAALHSSMVVCYGTMKNFLHESKPHSNDISATDDSSNSSSSSSSSTFGEISSNNGLEKTVSAPSKRWTQSTDEVFTHMMQDRTSRHRERSQARQLREQKRLHCLHQQQRRAFVSAVAKLRHSIIGVPLDIMRLAAVEMAVDKVCAELPTTNERRKLQQALLVVTQRLQNQNRRQRLSNGLRRSAAVVVSARSVSLSTAGARWRRGPRGSMHSSESDVNSPAEAFVSTATTATESRCLSSSCSTSTIGKGMQRRRSSSRMNSARHHGRSPSMVTSASSYYSIFDQYTGGEFYEENDDDDGFASLERRRRVQRQQQQRLLNLLSALAMELNAVDTRGLTPLHYAIANQNARMVYLLCAYGATFVFASAKTEKHLVRHLVEVVAAAAAAAALDSSSSNCTTTSRVKTASEAGRTPAASMSRGGGGGGGGPTVSPTMLSALTATPTNLSGTAHSDGSVNTAYQPHFSSVAFSPSMLVSASVVEATTAADSPANSTAMHTHLTAATPGINAATDAILQCSEDYYAQLTPAAQATLRKTAKMGSAVWLLLGLATREEQERERRATGRETMGLLLDAAADAYSNSNSDALPQPSAQHTTMAATLTEALGLGVSGGFPAATVGALRAWNEMEERDEAVQVGSSTAHARATEEVIEESKEASAQDLRLQLMNQEYKALQRMVLGTCEETSNNTASAGDVSAVAAANFHSETQKGTKYVLLEPHDVFLIHIVRNPAKADSIVRAAMEGTALRYLFHASVISKMVDT